MALKLGWYHFGKSMEFAEDERASKYPIATSETNICHYIILMSSWQLHSVGNGSTELQYLVIKVKTETKDKLAETYMKSKTPKKYLHSTHLPEQARSRRLQASQSREEDAVPQSSAPDLLVIYSVITPCPWKSKYCRFATYKKKIVLINT